MNDSEHHSIIVRVLQELEEFGRPIMYMNL